MALIPPLLLLFDTSALLAGNSRDWQEFARLGECYVAEGVLDAMEFMSDRAAEPGQESTAREFLRFYPTHGWKKTNILAEHASLKAVAGHTLSKRARLVLEVLQGAYGIALRYPDSLIILVSTDQPMLQKVTGLEKSNLCGLPLAALVQWSRSQRRPPVVSHHLQLMRATQNSATAAPKKNVATPASRQPGPTRATAPSAEGWSAPTPRRRRNRILTQLLRWGSNLVSIALLVAAIAIAWRFISPATFNQFWQQIPFVGNSK